MIALHGYTRNSANTNQYFGLSQRTTRDRFALILPNGTRNPEGANFWNATDYCCDFWGSGVDDVAYLNDLVVEAGEHIIAEGVYLVGLSNGAFMSYRMACESMPGLRGIVAVGGSTFHDPERCAGAAPVSVLHIHGTADIVIRYEGGSSNTGDTHYPGAEEAVRRWAARAGCDLAAAEDPGASRSRFHAVGRGNATAPIPCRDVQQGNHRRVVADRTGRPRAGVRPGQDRSTPRRLALCGALIGRAGRPVQHAGPAGPARPAS